MSYRVDIPTLSANEVYTLTFEYEGTETIQLIVGDLTLETTDRRVVFTTTSPVNYIESNVNLTNLNLYEGYYESDDFGGEYTQESYIEGRSLINYKRRVDYGTLINNTNIQETFTDDGYLNYKQLGTGATGGGYRGNGFVSGIDQSKNYTIILRVRKNTFPTDVFVPFTLCHVNYGVKFDGTVKGSQSGSGISYNIFGGQTGVWKAVVKGSSYNVSLSNRYWGVMASFFVDENSEVTDLTQRTDIVGCEIEYAIEVLQGDYFDIDTGIDEHFEGIGCVKSPKIVSHKAKNLVPAFEITSGYGSNIKIEVFDDNKHIEFAHTGNDARLQFQLDVASIGLTSGDLLGIEFDAITKGVGTVANKTSAHLVFSNIRNIDDKTNYFETGHYKNVIEIVDNPIQIHFRQNVSGANGNEYFIVKNFSVFKINSVDDMKDNYEECVVSTPDDLELYCNHYYDRNTKKSSPCYQDILDLTTGTITRKNIKVKLNDCIAKRGTVSGALVTVNGGDMVRINYEHTNSSTDILPVQIDGEVTGLSATGIALNASQGGYDGRWFPTGDIEHAYTNTNTIYMFFNPSRFDGIDYTDSTTIKNWLIEQDFTLIIKIQDASVYTEQLPTSINPLKSYRNGSIQTSSQQLAPTLKTTLPISNKFTTTNLTSGSTYNVYFDGTATKLDAGGTIITNPVSPCEVECGGTTLTIEGTDIQNVRVIETTVKNEVGSVNETTDVGLKKMKTCKYENILDDINYNTTVWNGAVININYDDFCIEFMGNHGWAAEFADTGLKYPTGCSLVHVEFDIDMDNPNLRMAINFNEGIYNSYPQHRHVTLNNDTATIAQGNYENVYTSIITKGHFSRLMYANGDRPIIINLYTGSYITNILATGNSAEGSIDGYETIGNNYGRITNLRMRIIENFSSNYTTVTSVLRDSSYNIIWQDMDMTMPTTTSKLEQPIKLRSLGTTYDSYNPVTGELVKRIGVSETDGSYSVLSSPIVMDTRKTEVNGYMADKNTICKEYSKGYEFNTSGQLFFSNIGHYTDYYIEIPENTKTLSFKGMSYYKRIMIYDENKKFIKCFYTYDNYGDATGNITSDMKYVRLTTVNEGSQGMGYGDMRSYLVTDTNYLVFTSDTSLQTLTVPQLYTNGQVKVYSDSEVYPTTILNGQSTNNYEVNELNTSNNYTIRYDGACESINLANKSNSRGTNRIIKAGATSGNLTFINDSGDIDNVLLVQNDVREQEIKHFNGLQTVEVSRMLIENQRNMWTNNPNNYEQINSWQVTSTHYIPVKSGEVIYGTWQENRYAGMTQYDENFNQLMGVNFFGPDSYGTGMSAPQQIDGYYRNQCTILENARYVRFTIPTYASSNIMFYRGSYQTELVTPTDKIYQGTFVDLPQPVQLNSLPDGTCDTYNPITGEYVQNVGYFVLDNTFASRWLIVKTKDGKPVAQRDLSTQEPNYSTLVRDYSFPGELYDYQAGTKAIANIPLAYYIDHTSSNIATPSLYGATYFGNHYIRIALPFTPNDLDQWNYSYTQVNNWLKENPIHIVYKRTEPITTQLTPINIPTFEGGIVQLITTDGKVFPMVEYSMPTNNRYDTSSWETGAVYTQRNITEAYFNESITPMTPTETMTLTTDHISSGSIILNDNGNGLIVLKGNYTGRDIPYFTGMRSVEAIEVETTPSPDQPLFGKGGRK